MNREGIIEKLKAANARLDTVSILSQPKDYAMNLVIHNGEFEIFYLEKGSRTQLGRFETLEAAVERFWELIEDDRSYFFN